MGWRSFGAVCAAVGLVWAGAARATVVDASLAGNFFSIGGPLGWFPAPGPGATYSIINNGSREDVSFTLGGLPWSLDFTFDTALTTQTIVSGYQHLSWTAGSGPNPILNGQFSWPYPGISKDLTQATSFVFSLGPGVENLAIGGPGYTLHFFVPINGLPTNFATPLDLTCCNLNSLFVENYQDANFTTPAAEIDQETLTPRAPVPEPATWALVIAGIGLAGAMLRRRRKASIAI